MCINTLKALGLTSLAAIPILTSSCSNSASPGKTEQYTGGPITLERPTYSNRPYRKRQKPVVAAKLKAPSKRTPAVLGYGNTGQGPIPFLPQKPVSLPTQATKPVQAAKPQPLGFSPFHTPDDLSLPTQNQVPAGL